MITSRGFFAKKKEKGKGGGKEQDDEEEEKGEWDDEIMESRVGYCCYFIYQASKSDQASQAR